MLAVYHRAWLDFGSAMYFCDRGGTELTLLLSENDVRELLPMGEAIDLVESALRLVGEGHAENRPRQRIPYRGGLFHYMAAAAPSSDAVGLKCYAAGRGGARFVVLLFATESPELLAIVEADWLGRIRTGAASGVATRLLARPDARMAAVFGAGKQAETQIEAIAAVRPLETVKVYSRSAERRESLVQEMQPRVSASLQPVSSAEEAISGADIVTTITTSRDPVFDGAWLEPGCHINAAGSNQAGRRELDAVTLSRASLIAVDSLEQARIEAGDLLLAEQEDGFDWGRVIELGALLADGGGTARTADAITVFESQGVAIEDIVVARHVYDKALAAGIGRRAELGDGDV